MPETSTDQSLQDRIERSIEIDAPIDRVWALVSQPGWWVSERVDPWVPSDPGTVVDSRSDDGHHYPVEVVALVPPTFAAFRWASQFEGVTPAVGTATLIEFTLTEHRGRVLLRVVESGFLDLEATDELRRSGFEANSGGWEQMLAWLREHVQA